MDPEKFFFGASTTKSSAVDQSASNNDGEATGSPKEDHAVPMEDAIPAEEGILESTSVQGERRSKDSINTKISRSGDFGQLGVDEIAGVQSEPALRILRNGVTIKATKPKDFYKNNQNHTLNGVQYKVVLSKEELKEMIDSGEDVTKVVTTFITDMEGLFLNKKTFNQAIGNWDVSNVENMDYLFAGAFVFNKSIEYWDVSKVRTMRNMFRLAKSFNKPIEKWTPYLV